MSKMELMTFKRIRNGAAAGMGVLTAIGAVMNNFLMPLVGISIGIIVIYLAKQRVSEIDVDERIILISQKASTATLALSIVTMSFTGLSLIFLSKGGYANLAIRIHPQLSRAHDTGASIILSLAL